MDLELTGRVIVVTGGSSGVGLALVEDLLSCGARVATCARDLGRLDEAMAAIGAADDHVLTMQCDVRDAEAVDRFIIGAHEEFGAIDGLVNNAGQSLMRPFADTTFDEWMAEFELKFGGVIHPITAARPFLASSSGSSVVNVNAVLARQPEPRLAATSAARAGLLNLTRTLANDLATDAIRVNSVLLGLIDTGQWRRRYEARTDDLDASWDDWSASLAADRGISLGRLGTAREVSYAITMLLSPRASYITGATLDVAGGVGRYV